MDKLAAFLREGDCLMSIAFDPGYVAEPFLTLCRDFPGPEVYDPDDFRIEWGPIFHRGRLDGTARILLIGQDPAQNENIVRRILVGVAGQRAQGFLRKLGLTRSYVLINAFLYSVFGQAAGQSHANDPPIIDYRNRWIDAILDSSPIEAVVAMGALAKGAWIAWKNARPAHPKRNVAVAHLTHPTQPESASAGDPTRLAQHTQALLTNWNAARALIRPTLTQTDSSPIAANYGATWKPAEIVRIPSLDLPAGIPDWMRNRDRWAARVGSTVAAKRANITLTVPADVFTAVAPPIPVRAPLAARGTRLAPAALAALPAERATGLLALTGTVVTMTSTILADHTIYIRDGVIDAVRPRGSAAPAGFEAVATLDTKALIFPGLIDLHNHLAYNVLPLWTVPKKFANRDDWSGLKDYKQLVSQPMSALADLPGALPALCRYVECKAMFGGATTSQGIALVNHNNVRTFFRGLLRNAESTNDPALPAAQARIGDVLANDLAKFRKTLASAKSCYILHLAEGSDPEARSHFLALKDGTKWALSGALAGIHCVPLTAQDFKILADHGSAMVWSVLSNLLLYGQTADVQAAKAAGIRIGLGPDWSPSGSKNLLGELKVARAYSDLSGGLFTDEELVALATRNAASILKWDSLIGTIEPGKLADLLIVRGSKSKPYTALIKAAETDIELLVIGGIRRYGVPALMKKAAPGLETVKIGGEARVLNLWPAAPAGTDDEDDDQPNLPGVTFADARKLLKDALANLGTLAPAAPHLRALNALATGGWQLALDEIEHTGKELRMTAGLSPRVARRGITRPVAAAVAAPIKPVALDPPTVADDPTFLKRLKAQKNLPAKLASRVAALY